MIRRFEGLAHVAGGALFLVGACFLLPMIMLRHLTAVLAAWPTGPLG